MAITAGDKRFNVCIDGINMVPYLTGEVKESPRTHFFYVSDDGGIMAIRIGDYKLSFEIQEMPGTMKLWAQSVYQTAPSIYLSPASRSV